MAKEHPRASTTMDGGTRGQEGKWQKRQKGNEESSRALPVIRCSDEVRRSVRWLLVKGVSAGADIN